MKYDHEFSGLGGRTLVLAKRADLDGQALAFRQKGRILIRDILEDAFAKRLHRRLANWSEWALVTRINGEHRSFDANGMDSVPPDKRAAFDELVAVEARQGFQYLYERYPLYDHARMGVLKDDVLGEAVSLVRSPEFLGLGRRLTGNDSITFADAQLTRYRRGHFLTLHDDTASGMNRIAAFVINLTPDWAADFGGQLQFVDKSGAVEEVFVPGFNTLSMFAVPHPHAVSVVAPFVATHRYAITGWLRTGAEPPVP